MNRLGFVVGFLLLFNFGTLELSKAGNILLGISPIIAGNRGIEGPNDTTPNPFTFQAIYNVSRSTQILSNTITVTGINSPAPISITNGFYSIDGGGFVNTPGVVRRNQKVCVRVNSSGSYSTQTLSTITIGGVQGWFIITTGGKLSLLPNGTNFFSYSGKLLFIVGEIKNNSSQYLRFIKAGGSIFSNDGKLVDADSTYTYKSTLAPGEKTCFKLMFSNTEGATHYYLEQPTYSSIGAPLPKITPYNHSGFYNQTYNRYEIVGMLRNDSGHSVSYVQPVATLYNSAGEVIGCDYTFVNSTHLAAGQSSAFKINFSWNDYHDVALYRLQVNNDY